MTYKNRIELIELLNKLGLTGEGVEVGVARGAYRLAGLPRPSGCL